VLRLSPVALFFSQSPACWRGPPHRMAARRACCACRPSAPRRSRSPTRTTSGSSIAPAAPARRLTSFPGQTVEPNFSPDGKWIAFSGEYAGNTDVYVVPADRRRAEAPDVASRRRHGAGLDARRQVDPLRVARATWAPSGAPRFWTVPVEGGVEDRRCRCRALSGQDLARRQAHRLSHEQLVGRGAPQLSRRPESPDLDRRSQDLRSRLAAVDRFEGHGSGVGRRHRYTSSPIATACRTSGPTTRRRRSSRR
jgi:hypothetical protein